MFYCINNFFGFSYDDEYFNEDGSLDISIEAVCFDNNINIIKQLNFDDCDHNINIFIKNSNIIYNRNDHNNIMLECVVFLNSNMNFTRYLDNVNNFYIEHCLFMNCDIDFEKIDSRINEIKKYNIYSSYFINVNTNDILNMFEDKFLNVKFIHNKVFYKNNDVTKKTYNMVNIVRNNGLKISNG